MASKGKGRKRREVIMQSARVAILALFGPAGIQTTVDLVLDRMAEVKTTQAIAQAVARHLQDAGLLSAAYGCTCEDCESS